MNDSYYFRTSDPDYIRHAPSMLEILSKAFPTIITQQESEYELQRLNPVSYTHLTLPTNSLV